MGLIGPATISVFGEMVGWVSLKPNGPTNQHDQNGTGAKNEEPRRIWISSNAWELAYTVVTEFFGRETEFTATEDINGTWAHSTHVYTHVHAFVYYVCMHASRI